MRPTSRLYLIVVVLALGLASLTAQINTFTYQGRVQTDGTDFTGTGQFKFALVTVTNANRTATATVNAPSAGFITTISVVSGGNGYVAPPAVTITGGGGSGATATAIISGGSVTAITVNNPGSGYTWTPLVTLAPPPENLSFTTYWSHDGTSTAGSEPVGAVRLPVQSGLFTAVLGDTTLAGMAALPPELFRQTGLHLRIWFSDGAHGFAAMHPPQPLSGVPYALVAGSLLGSYSNAVTFSSTNNVFVGSGAGLTGLNASQLTNGTVPNERLSSQIARLSQVWERDGNSSATLGVHFLGTIDFGPLEFRVQNERALLIEANFGSPNLTAGYSSNVIGPHTFGSVIAGGGYINQINEIQSQASSSAIGGGKANTIQSNAYGVTISGGIGNTIGTNAVQSVIGGGYLNSILNNDWYSTISGGVGNKVEADASSSFIGGGSGNIVRSNALSAMIPGGRHNRAASYAFAAGSYAEANHDGAFVWADAHANEFRSTSTNQFLIRAGGGVGINKNNPASALDVNGTVTATALDVNGTVTATGFSGNGNGLTSLNAGAVTGSLYLKDNTAWLRSPGDTNHGIGWYGVSKLFASNSVDGPVLFGYSGGALGFKRSATEGIALTWDSSRDVTAQNNLTVNGSLNIAGSQYLQDHDIQFRNDTFHGLGWYGAGKLFAGNDVNGPALYGNGGGVLGTRSGSTDTPALFWKSSGNVGIGTNNPAQKLVVAGNIFATGTITPNSDRNLKTGFSPVDTGAVLEQVAKLPIQEWRFLSEPAQVKHVGPMAQDFRAAFGLGEIPTAIATVDADGVALAAIQGLNRKLEQKLEQKESEIADLKQRLEKLERLVNAQLARGN